MCTLIDAGRKALLGWDKEDPFGLIHQSMPGNMLESHFGLIQWLMLDNIPEGPFWDDVIHAGYYATKPFWVDKLIYAR